MPSPKNNSLDLQEAVGIRAIFGRRKSTQRLLRTVRSSPRENPHTWLSPWIIFRPDLVIELEKIHDGETLQPRTTKDLWNQKDWNHPALGGLLYGFKIKLFSGLFLAPLMTDRNVCILLFSWRMLEQNVPQNGAEAASNLGSLLQRAYAPLKDKVSTGINCWKPGG